MSGASQQGEELLLLPEHSELVRLPGWLKPVEGARLAYLAAQVPRHLAIVEVGSFKGKSTSG